MDGCKSGIFDSLQQKWEAVKENQQTRKKVQYKRRCKVKMKGEGKVLWKIMLETEKGCRLSDTFNL